MCSLSASKSGNLIVMSSLVKIIEKQGLERFQKREGGRLPHLPLPSGKQIDRLPTAFSLLAEPVGLQLLACILPLGKQFSIHRQLHNLQVILLPNHLIEGQSPLKAWSELNKGSLTVLGECAGWILLACLMVG